MPVVEIVVDSRNAEEHISQVAKKLRDLGNHSEIHISSSGISKALKEVQELEGKAGSAISNIKRLPSQILTEMQSAFKDFDKAERAFDKARSEIIKLENTLKRLGTDGKQGTKEFQDKAAALDKMLIKSGQLAPEIDKLGKKIVSLNQELVKEKKELDALASAYDKTSQSAKKAKEIANWDQNATMMVKEAITRQTKHPRADRASDLNPKQAAELLDAIKKAEALKGLDLFGPGGKVFSQTRALIEELEKVAEGYKVIANEAKKTKTELSSGFKTTKEHTEKAREQIGIDVEKQKILSGFEPDKNKINNKINENLKIREGLLDAIYQGYLSIGFQLDDHQRKEILINLEKQQFRDHLKQILGYEKSASEKAQKYLLFQEAISAEQVKRLRLSGELTEDQKDLLQFDAKRQAYLRTEIQKLEDIAATTKRQLDLEAEKDRQKAQNLLKIGPYGTEAQEKNTIANLERINALKQKGNWTEADASKQAAYANEVRERTEDIIARTIALTGGEISESKKVIIAQQVREKLLQRELALQLGLLDTEKKRAAKAVEQKRLQAGIEKSHGTVGGMTYQDKGAQQAMIAAARDEFAANNGLVDSYEKKAEKIHKTNKAVKELRKSSGEYVREIGRLETAFTQYAIVMSGIAATLFVVQTAMRGIGKMVDIGRKMTETMAALKIELAGVAQNAGAVEKALKGASLATGVGSDQTIEVFKALMGRGLSEKEARDRLQRISGYMKYPGMTAERAAQIGTNDIAGEAKFLDRFVEEVNNGLGGSFDRMNQNFQSLIEKFVLDFEQPLKDLIEKISQMIDLLKLLVGKTSEANRALGEARGQQDKLTLSGYAPDPRKAAITSQHRDLSSDSVFFNLLSGKISIVDVFKNAKKNMDRLSKNESMIPTIPARVKTSAEQIEEMLKETKETVQNKADLIDIPVEIPIKVMITAEQQLDAENTVFQLLGFADGPAMHLAFKDELNKVFGGHGEKAAHMDATFGAGTSERVKFILSEQEYIKNAKALALQEIKGYDLKELELDEKLFQEKQILTKNHIAYRENLYKKLYDMDLIYNPERREMNNMDRWIQHSRDVLAKSLSMHEAYYNETGIMTKQHLQDQLTSIDLERQSTVETFKAMRDEHMPNTQEYEAYQRRIERANALFDRKASNVAKNELQNRLSHHDEYYNAIGEMTEEHYQAELDMISMNKDLLKQKLGESFDEEKWMREQMFGLYMKDSAAMVAAYEDAYDTTGFMSQELYDHQVELINKKADIIRENTKSEAYAIEYTQKRMLALHIDLLHQTNSISQGALLAAEKLKSEFQSMGETGFQAVLDAEEVFYRSFIDMAHNGAEEATDIFKAMCEEMKALFIQTIAEMAYQSYIKPIVVTFVQAMAGAPGTNTAAGTQGANGGSGANGLLQQGASWLWNESGLGSTVSGWLGMSGTAVNAGTTIAGNIPTLYSMANSSLSFAPELSAAANLYTPQAAYASGLGDTSALASFSEALSAVAPYLAAFSLGSMGYGYVADWTGLPQSEYSGMGAGAGAAAGFYAGSAIPVIGNIAGAVIGAILGGLGGSLFGGQESKKYVDLKNMPNMTSSWGYGQTPEWASFDTDQWKEGINNVGYDNLNDYDKGLSDMMFSTVMEGLAPMVQSVYDSIDDMLSQMPEELASDIRRDLDSLGDVFTLEGIDKHILRNRTPERMQADIERILAETGEMMSEIVSPVVEKHISGYLQELITDASGTLSNLDSQHMLSKFVGNRAIFNEDFSRADGAEFETYGKSASEFLAVIGQIQGAWDAVTQGFELMLNPLSQYQQEVENITATVDSAINVLKQLGFNEETLAEARAKGLEVIKAVSDNRAKDIDAGLSDGINKLTLSDDNYSALKFATELEESLQDIAELGPDYAYLVDKAQELYALQLKGLDLQKGYFEKIYERADYEAFKMSLNGKDSNAIELKKVSIQHGWGADYIDDAGEYIWSAIYRDVIEPFKSGTVGLEDFKKLAEEVFGMDDWGTLADQISAVNSAFEAMKTQMSSVADRVKAMGREWDNFVGTLMVSDLAPVQSEAGLQNEFMRLMGQAGSGDQGDISSLYSFVQSQYLPFMRDYTGGGQDYASIFNSMVSPSGPIGGMSVDLGHVDIDSAAIGDAVAQAIRTELLPYIVQSEDGTTHVHVHLNGQEIGNAIVQNVQTNENFVSAIRSIV